MPTNPNPVAPKTDTPSNAGITADVPRMRLSIIGQSEHVDDKREAQKPERCPKCNVRNGHMTGCPLLEDYTEDEEEERVSADFYDSGEVEYLRTLVRHEVENRLEEKRKKKHVSRLYGNALKKVRELESTLAAERASRDQLHAKFGFVPAADDPKKCACAYCVKDFEAIADMCAEYECAIELDGGYKDQVRQLRASRVKAEEALRKVRSHVLLATFPVDKDSDQMLVSKERVYEALQYTDLSKPSVSPEQAEETR